MSRSHSARVPRIYCHALPEEGHSVSLYESASRHVLRVLRLRPGAELRLFDGGGREHRARLDGGDPRAAAVTVLDPCEPLPESPLHVTLLQGVSRGERMDLVVQKTTELGVASIIPVRTARSVVRLEGHRAKRRWLHWQSVAISACEQCGRATVPTVRMPVDLDLALKVLTELGDPASRLLPDPSAADSLADLDPPAAGVTLLIGPEGGLDEDERATAVAAGFRPVRLGPRVLRTETAAIAALALVQGLWGDLAR